MAEYLHEQQNQYLKNKGNLNEPAGDFGINHISSVGSQNLITIDFYQNDFLSTREYLHMAHILSISSSSRRI